MPELEITPIETPFGIDIKIDRIDPESEAICKCGGQVDSTLIGDEFYEICVDCGRLFR